MDNTLKKYCIDCLKYKSASEFYNRGNTRDGLSLRCRTCISNKEKEIEIPDFKACIKCGSTLPISAFRKNNNSYEKVCKVCRKPRSKKEQKDKTKISSIIIQDEAVSTDKYKKRGV